MPMEIIDSGLSCSVSFQELTLTLRLDTKNSPEERQPHQVVFISDCVNRVAARHDRILGPRSGPTGVIVENLVDPIGRLSTYFLGNDAVIPGHDVQRTVFSRQFSQRYHQLSLPRIHYGPFPSYQGFYPYGWPIDGSR